jgi:hypothetical protein
VAAEVRSSLSGHPPDTPRWFEDFERFGDRGSGYVGFRFGMSVFLE